MDKRFAGFVAVTIALMLAYQLLLAQLGIGRRAPVAQKAPAAANGKQPVAKPAGDMPAANGDAPVNAPEPAPPPPVAAASPDRRVAIGSLDPTSPYQMLVVLNSHGAAVERIELNNPRYGDLPQYDAAELDGGYLGHLAVEPSPGGVRATVVGAGTPAANAGLSSGDVITAVAGNKVTSAAEFARVLARYRPGTTIAVQYERSGGVAQASVVLAEYPLSLIRPENKDPLSLLCALVRVDGADVIGTDWRKENWELTRSTASSAEFHAATDSGLLLIKRYELKAVESKDEADEVNGYDLKFTFAIENTTDKDHRLVYELDGPNGLPTEAWWYGSKISTKWFSSAGIRDVVAQYYQNGYPSYSAAEAIGISKSDLAVVEPNNPRHLPLIYAGVDAQYFSAVLKPLRKLDPASESDPWFSKFEVMRVGPVPADTKYRKVVNTSFRLTSNEIKLGAGKSVVGEYNLFAVPKRPDILAAHGLSDVLQYGWFGFVARPMSSLLHLFYSWFGNYGIAIIILTVLVRLCMFPVSRKQALGAQKMQLLQPEMKKLAEKYKTQPEQRMKAQQELFRKHNYNPLAGCLPLFLQLPIFIGLYRSLMVDVELRQAPLIPGLGWCSNLAAPDMLWNWSSVMPGFITHSLGMGPFLNVFPLITVALFLWQQKLFMPPPADEQAEMQQKVMKYMMIFMAFMFYTVASGLCLYFIVSSLWGIAERKLLPKTLPAASSAEQTPPTAQGDSTKKKVEALKSLFLGNRANGNGSAARRRKERGKRR